MKKLLLLVLTTFLLTQAYTQSLELYFEGDLIAPDDEIVLQAHPDSGMMVIDTLDVKNNSSVNIDVLCIREIVENVEGTTNTFCWGLCYPPFTDTSSVFVSIDAQAVSYEFSGDHDPSGISGITKVKYTFYDQNNPDDRISVFVKYDHSDPNAIAHSTIIENLSNAYPNPADAFVKLDYNLPEISHAKIALYNLLGSKVKEIELTDLFGTLKINTSYLIEGIYFYSLLINNEAVLTQKLIIKH